MSEDMSPYCSAHHEWLIMKRCIIEIMQLRNLCDSCFRNGSIIYRPSIPTCKVFIMTEFNTIFRRFMLQSPLQCP